MFVPFTTEFQGPLQLKTKVQKQKIIGENCEHIMSCQVCVYLLHLLFKTKLCFGSKHEIHETNFQSLVHLLTQKLFLGLFSFDHQASV